MRIDDRDELDPAEVEPTDNSSGVPVDLDRVRDTEAELVSDDPVGA
jgi:hypothetical protein